MTSDVRETDLSSRNEAVQDRLLRPEWTILAFGLVAVLQKVGLGVCCRSSSGPSRSTRWSALASRVWAAEHGSLAEANLAVCWPGRRLSPPC